MMKAIRSFETSVLTRTTRPHIHEDAFIRSHRRENLKSYMPTYRFIFQNGGYYMYICMYVCMYVAWKELTFTFSSEYGDFSAIIFKLRLHL
jgi:hypothetical protein